MQDRFKFRYFHHNTKKMYSVKSICFEGEPFVTVAYKPILKYRLIDGYLMQCTGLKDKNGKLIYEGDIVVKIWDNRFFKIIWKDDACCFMAENKNFTISIYSLISLKNDLEVIGNLYENPELLEDK